MLDTLGEQNMLEKNKEDNINQSVTFETNREKITIEHANVEDILDKKIHVFAVCITADGIPIIGIRRTSFMYQSIISKRRSFSEILAVDISDLKYMYNNEIKEICIRSITPFTFSGFDSFEELVLLGGKVKNKESIYQCLSRELAEESDEMITIKSFGNNVLKLCIEDKILFRRFHGYCIICVIDQEYEEIKKSLYNIEIKALESLLDKTSNEKYEYLNFIYNTLTNNYGTVL
ncbi:SWPV2-ORF072 [Shearwaterpox virus]|uniref:SWPV2-ORF072 n=1 Tax=Shearwaterpox virus TaxID=1974596 RepID=A0A1V0QG34_CNPV|nr:SWPV2-ORF072 [Shearwaterpox virus]QRM15353.1 mutT motif [Mudlarkpox virus]